jgi:cellobiose phosphorylase
LRYGHFDDARREYVVTEPSTPLPWVNYIGTERYFGLVTNTAGGYSFYRDARLRRVIRYRYNNAPMDLGGGRYLYLRDDKSGDFWSPTWQPTRAPLEGYRCRHGLSYSVISSSRGGIEAESLYFVPLGASLEIWRLRLHNRRPTAASVSVFSSVEFCLWDALDDATNFQRNFSTGEVEVEGSVIYHKTGYRERRDHFAFFACSEPLLGYDTDREAFLGPGRGFERPLAVERGRCSGSVAHGWAPHGAHHVSLALAAGEHKELVFLLGYYENPVGEKFDPPGSNTLNKAPVRLIIEHWLSPRAVEEAFLELRGYWDGLLERLSVSTPDAHTNRMVNSWNPYQCMVNFNVSRSASLFESGVGRGIGFRDSNQDLLGFVHMVPQSARQRLLDLASTQLSSGGAYHQYQPLTKRGNDAIGSGFNDDPLWLVLSVAAYLKETGDGSLLTENVPYESLPGTEEAMFEHLRRALRYTLERLGPHGLPLIGRADWNDCLNLNVFLTDPDLSFQTAPNLAGGQAESVLIAGLFCLAADEMAAICTHWGGGWALPGEAFGYHEAARSMRSALGEHAWDGAWWRRAYDHYGRPVGSKDNEEGQIFVEPQGICTMAGVGLADGRARAALDSVRERLATAQGVALLQPAFTRYHIELGEISTYPPGYKENAGIFCHTNPWVMIAEAMLGDGDAAFHYYRLTNPSFREAISEVHRCEPYVYAQMIAGPDAPTHGEAKNSWLTGTAAWSYVAITQWILGVRPEHNGLRIDPVLPASWPGFSCAREWRGATYRISVTNPAGRGARVRSLWVDGKQVGGNLVPPAVAGAVVLVEAQAEPL